MKSVEFNQFYAFLLFYGSSACLIYVKAQSSICFIIASLSVPSKVFHGCFCGLKIFDKPI